MIKSILFKFIEFIEWNIQTLNVTQPNLAEGKFVPVLQLSTTA